ncbi:MAG: hemagglutinin repeat-containing protein, partial [Proteobacteria bacterium]|nr:hemagglutinin repeat-containing protein [Pseudomonadota bacterium]
SNTTSSAINTGTAALAELDLSLVSGEDTSLIGAELAAGGKLSVTTGGDFSVQAAFDIGGKTSLSLYDYAGTDGEAPQNLYPEELLAI